jgi:hypothetical protein
MNNLLGSKVTTADLIETPILGDMTPYVCVCVCVCVYIYIYICIYTHTLILSVPSIFRRPFLQLRLQFTFIYMVAHYLYNVVMCK